MPCPGPNAPRIGDVAQSKKEKVSGFELQTIDGQQICVTLYEPIPFTEQYLPCLLYTSPSPRDAHESRMPSSA